MGNPNHEPPRSKLETRSRELNIVFKPQGNFGRFESRTIGREIKQIQIKMSTTCSKNEQQQKSKITLINKDFGPPGKKCLFLLYCFWTLNSNMSPEFLHHPHLSIQVTVLESSEPGH